MQLTTQDSYKHGLIPDLVKPDLLKAVRGEILTNLTFKLIETDVYRVYRSADLANLDALDVTTVSRFPSLLKLRDTLYSSTFRAYLSSIVRCGPLSATHTSMAVNAYIPGCFLHCHDDGIGTRKVSYILYILDPDVEWQPEWGGSLRLYPTTNQKRADGVEVKVPTPDYDTVIPPVFNQLVFFMLQPNQSWHDVEEVVGYKVDEFQKDGERIRMAISGWFHVPQDGEDGYEEGLAEMQTKKAFMREEERKTVENFDLLQAQWRVLTPVFETTMSDKTPLLTDKELRFLSKYMSPQHLTPDATVHFSFIRCTLSRLL